MKDFSNLSKEEILQLTEEELNEWYQLEVMKAGALLFQPEEAKEVKLPPPDMTFYSIEIPGFYGKVYTLGKKDAERLQSAIMSVSLVERKNVGIYSVLEPVLKRECPIAIHQAYSEMTALKHKELFPAAKNESDRAKEERNKYYEQNDLRLKCYNKTIGEYVFLQGEKEKLDRLKSIFKEKYLPLSETPEKAMLFFEMVYDLTEEQKREILSEKVLAEPSNN